MRSAGDALAREVLAPAALGHEERVGDRVGQHAVDLLGHRAVERAQPGLDVRDRDPLLHRDERARDRAVDVADDHDDGRRAPRRGPARTRVMTSAVCSAWMPEPTSRLRHGGSIPSSSKNTSDMCGRSAGRCGRSGAARRRAPRSAPRERRDLHEVRPRAGDREDVEDRRRHGRAVPSREPRREPREALLERERRRVAELRRGRA